MRCGSIKLHILVCLSRMIRTSSRISISWNFFNSFEICENCSDGRRPAIRCALARIRIALKIHLCSFGVETDDATHDASGEKEGGGSNVIFNHIQRYSFHHYFLARWSSIVWRFVSSRALTPTPTIIAGRSVAVAISISVATSSPPW